MISTLSVLEPFRRAVVGVPFLYQKVRRANADETLKTAIDNSPDILTHPRHSSRFRSVTQYLLCRCQRQWLRGLDGCPKTGFACMDRAVSDHQANYQRKPGESSCDRVRGNSKLICAELVSLGQLRSDWQRFNSVGWQRTAILGGIEGWRAVHCAPQV